MKPLADLTVVDLTVNIPGPFCSMILGDLGGRVIKVEPPGGDPFRKSPDMWAGINRGKQSIVLDLKTSGGREVLRELVLLAGIVLEGWRPGVAKRLGADYETLSERNPALVYCSISGFGQDGPWKDRPGHDINYLALTGYLGLQADIEGRPWPPATLVSDMAAGLHAAISTLAAVNGAKVSGQGAYIDLSMAEAALSMLTPELSEAAAGNRSDGQSNVTSIPHYGLFLCSDDKWLSLGIVHEDHFWSRFCAVAGLDSLEELDLSERIARGQELRELIQRTVATREAAEWEKLLLEADVPAAIVARIEDVFQSPQLKARGAHVDRDSRRYLSYPARFSTGSVAPSGAPPGLGNHTDSIISELGLDPDIASAQEQTAAVASPKKADLA